MFDIKKVVLFFLAFLVSLGANAEQILVNKPQSENDRRYDYPHQLLQMIFDETEDDYGRDYVAHSKLIMSRERMLLSLIDGELIHVVAEAPKKEWVEKLLVVRIPIRKGIQGYRLFFINKEDQASIDNITTLNDFMRMPTGSGAGWSTAMLMCEAGFEVVKGSNYEGLFDMLEKRRFLTFGRGVNEIFSEFNSQTKRHPNLAIESSLAIHFPLPTYFFVSPKYPLLVSRIEDGLLRLIANGKFDEYFLLHHQEVIADANLKSRKIFSLDNPNLSSADPLDDKGLWYTF